MISTLILAAGCCQYGKKDLELAAEYKALLTPYHTGDTIYFSSDDGDLDTLTISGIDSNEHCGGLMGHATSNAQVRICHLPDNLWTDGNEIIDGHGIRTIDQELVTIGRSPALKGRQYYIGFEYREFHAWFDTIPPEVSGSLLADLGIKEYWNIVTEVPKEHQQDNAVVKIIWTTRFGLTAYYKKNGAYYRIRSSARTDR